MKEQFAATERSGAGRPSSPARQSGRRRQTGAGERAVAGARPGVGGRPGAGGQSGFGKQGAATPAAHWACRRHRHRHRAAAVVTIGVTIGGALVGCQGTQRGTGAASATATTTATATTFASASAPVVTGTPTGGATAAAPLPDCLAGQPAGAGRCYTPDQIRVAYGVTPLLDRGVDGRGVTVVLPEAVALSDPGYSDIRQDLALFDRRFGLPAARLTVSTRLAPGAAPYLAGGEEVGDAEMVHAIAPGAAIEVILLPQGFVAAEFAPMLRLAATLGTVVSVSGGLGEHCFTAAALSTLNAALETDEDHHVTVIASAGDTGAASIPCSGDSTAPAPEKGVSVPAADPLVLAVGGTSLQINSTSGAYQGETAWNTPLAAATERLRPADLEPAEASGGGFSNVFARPSYQAGVAGLGTRRGVPDVAADASPDTGMAGIQDVGGQAIIGPLDGTSASAPLWAGIIALADQEAGRPLGFVNPALYRIGRSRAYPNAFHDVRSGNNTARYANRTITGYQAAPGWDPVTGWGTPNAQALVPLLAQKTQQP
jgi:subtilase family serine protease